MQEIGESREQWGRDVMEMAEDFANNMKSEVKPFYIVYACKSDKSNENVFRQSMKAYYNRPPKLLGVLVWYVNHPLGEFRFVPELSFPPDVPLDPHLLSDKAYDAFGSVSSKGQEVGVLLS